jgi:hypothetical protein
MISHVYRRIHPDKPSSTIIAILDAVATLTDLRDGAAPTGRPG